MEFVDDIALGNLSARDLGEGDEFGGRDSGTARSYSSLQLSFLVSAILHSALAALLFYFLTADNGQNQETSPRTINVEFVSTNPFSQLEETLPEAIAESEASAPLETVERLAPALDEPSPESVPIADVEPDAIAVTEDPPVERADTGPQRQSEPIALPSVESVQRAVNSLQRSEASQFYSYDCNRLEEKREFNDCAPAERGDYAAAISNPVYDFHNPAIEVSRSEETVTMLARQSALVTEQLALGDLPRGLSAYVMEELELGIETYSNNSGRAVEHMNTMVDRSAAGAMARRMFDSWVQQQSLLLQGRRVETRSDQQFRARCRSYEKFIMAPAEFARCLSMGESPLGFTLSF